MCVLFGALHRICLTPFGRFSGPCEEYCMGAALCQVLFIS